jgi:hypothetical protein
MTSVAIKIILAKAVLLSITGTQGNWQTPEAGWPLCGAGSKGLRLDAIDKPPGDFSQADLRANYSMYRSYSWQ